MATKINDDCVFTVLPGVGHVAERARGVLVEAAAEDETSVLLVIWKVVSPSRFERYSHADKSTAALKVTGPCSNSMLSTVSSASFNFLATSFALYALWRGLVSTDLM